MSILQDGVLKTTYEIWNYIKMAAGASSSFYLALNTRWNN